MTALQAECRDVEGKLRKAEQQEHDYNYRCYGPFKWVWENDVALAKEKVKRYQAQIKEMQDKIQQASEAATSFEMGVQGKEATRKRVEVEEMVKVYRQNETSVHGKMKKIEKALAMAGAKLNALVKQEGKESCAHLLDSMAAMREVGQCGLQAAGTSEVMVSGWVKDVNFLGMTLSYLARKARTLGEQKQMLETLKKWTDDENNVLCVFMKAAPPVMDLSSCYSFEDNSGSSKRPRLSGTPVLTAEVTDAEMTAILEELKQAVIQEVNTQSPEMQAIIAERVEAIESGKEPSAVNLEPQPASEEPVPQGSSDGITFIDSMADDFE